MTVASALAPYIGHATTIENVANIFPREVGLASDSVAKLDYLRILVTAYSNSGRFLSRFRLMPWRDFVIRLVVSIFLMAFRLF
jgi:hypothetical protein